MIAIKIEQPDRLVSDLIKLYVFAQSWSFMIAS